MSLADVEDDAVLAALALVWGEPAILPVGKNYPHLVRSLRRLDMTDEEIVGFCNRAKHKLGMLASLGDLDVEARVVHTINWMKRNGE